MKRRLARFILPMLIPAILTSCWKTDEDWSLCPDDNLTLEFSIDGVPDAQFGQHIGEFDVYLFDADHRLVEVRKITEADEDGVYRTVYTLDPGSYYAVCWGNTGTNSLLTPPDESRSLENSFVRIDGDETGGPIYYAPYKAPEVRTDDTRYDDYTLYEIVVPEIESVVRELVFRKVHRTVEVFISRYEGTSHDDGKAPIVERTGARASFDFLLRAEMTSHTLRRTAAASGRSEATLSTLFHSALTPIQGDGWVRVIHPTTGQALGEVNIADYIRQHGIEDDSYIPIHFIFGMDANVTVTMPSWNDNEITPGR